MRHFYVPFGKAYAHLNAELYPSSTLVQPGTTVAPKAQGALSFRKRSDDGGSGSVLPAAPSCDRIGRRDKNHKHYGCEDPMEENCLQLQASSSL
uniref:Uncharacterized protein n=1 Tax=Steinernema glaseri TaxID=37863 RepID=A0A1I7Y0K1_9BILA